jgi:hypothetical protein
VRTVRLTDRYGASITGAAATIERFAALLDALAAGDRDEEHGTVSMSDSDEWNLAFSAGGVTFENLEGDVVGELRGLTREQRLSIADQFSRGDLDAVRAWGWVL